jgi:hypothetical protein
MKFARIPSLSMALAIAAATLPAGGASAADRDQKFFESVKGNWAGPGEIVAGKYKGTKFNCTFAGSTPGAKTGMVLDGGCRVGVFTQKMSASIERKGKTYRGTFMDGAEGKGLDVVGGNVVEGGQKVVFAINRKQLNGIMQARMADAHTMNVTVSVRVEEELVPVIGMSLKRLDSTAVGSVQ